MRQVQRGANPGTIHREVTAPASIAALEAVIREPRQTFPAVKTHEATQDVVVVVAAVVDSLFHSDIWHNASSCGGYL